MNNKVIAYISNSRIYKIEGLDTLHRNSMSVMNIINEPEATWTIQQDKIEEILQHKLVLHFDDFGRKV